MAISNPERLELYNKLLAAAKKQLQLCKSADWEQEDAQQRLFELIEHRQALIEQISVLDQEPLTSNERQVVEEILAVDEQTAKMMASFKDQFARKLKHVRQGMRTTKAYNPEAVQTEGYFIDRRE